MSKKPSQLALDVKKYLDKWKSSGKPTTKYRCPNCLEYIETTMPSRKGEVWDSATQCHHCNKMHFKMVNYLGKTEIQNMEVTHG